MAKNCPKTAKKWVLVQKSGPKNRPRHHTPIGFDQNPLFCSIWLEKGGGRVCHDTLQDTTKGWEATKEAGWVKTCWLVTSLRVVQPRLIQQGYCCSIWLEKGGGRSLIRCPYLLYRGGSGELQALIPYLRTRRRSTYFAVTLLYTSLFVYCLLSSLDLNIYIQ